MEQFQTLLELESKLNKTIGKIKEGDLFKILKHSIFPSLVKTSDKYNKHYCIIDDGAIELKCRRSHYLTLRLQKDKYDHLQQFHRKYYICSTNCGIYLFDLDRITPIWEETLNPRNTDFNDNTLILKETYDIPLNKGKNITGIILKKLKK